MSKKFQQHRHNNAFAGRHSDVDQVDRLPRALARADLDARTRSEETGIHGMHAVTAVLQHQPERIIELLVDDRRAGGPLAEFVLDVRARGVPIRVTSRDFLDRIAGGARHQGVAARVRPYAYAQLDELLEPDPCAVLVLDSVEDPRNLGAAARAAYALGASGLLVPKDRSAPVTPAAEHVAAGALSHLPVARETNLVRALDELKQSNIWVIGAEADAKLKPWDVDMTTPLAIVIGGEDSGLRRLVRQHCDMVVSIPMVARGLSLNAADAACVLLYEMARQRQVKRQDNKAPHSDAQGQ